MLKKIFIGVLALLGAIQFIRPSKNSAVAGESVLENDISSLYAVPSGVNNILQFSCYDCHSNNTKYPWYANIQPFGLWLQSHVDDGKRALNFSEFARYDSNRQLKNIEEIEDEIKHKKMPLPSYLKMHKKAALTPYEIEILFEWTASVKRSIRGF